MSKKALGPRIPRTKKQPAPPTRMADLSRRARELPPPRKPLDYSGLLKPAFREGHEWDGMWERWGWQFTEWSTGTAPAKPRAEMDASGFHVAELRHRIEPAWNLESIEILTFMRVRERDSSNLIEVHRITCVRRDAWERMTAQERAKQLRAEYLQLLTHELDEQLIVDGVRVFDPHNEARRLEVT